MTTPNDGQGNPRLFHDVFQVVKLIPPGKVLTYGQVGREACTSARIVGWAMSNVDGEEIPWQRVVGAGGYLRIGRRSPELMALQRSLLEREGVAFLDNGTVDMRLHSDYSLEVHEL